MKPYELKLNDSDLLNLHKALLEAKFHMTPENELVAGSPVVANIYIQIRDLLIESDRSGQWKDWFLLKNRPDRRGQAIALMQRSKRRDRWEQMTLEEKRKFARNYLAPFLFDEEELENVIAEADGGG